jgi:hypothetical protein
MTRRWVLGLLVIPILFNLIFLWPELSISRYPLNDYVFHFAAIQRLAETGSLRAWLPQCMGYPVWSVYQPGAHVVTAALMRALWWVDPQTTFVWVHYLLLSFMPLSFYALARALGLNRMGGVAAACLSISPSSTGQFTRADVGYAGYVWRSWGLYAQLWGIALGLPALALTLRAVRTGKHLVWAGLALTAAIMCHFMVGWILLVSLAGLLVFERPLPWRRALVVLGIAAPLPAWFAARVWINYAWVNDYHWGEAWRNDSFGATEIVSSLANGSLFDFGRFPVLTLLIVAGAVLAWRKPLWWVTVGWLVVFFGRATWGRALELIGLPGGFQAHRAQLGFEIFALMLAAWAVQRAIERGPRRWALAGVLAFAAVLTPMYAERRTYLAENARWGQWSLDGLHAQQADIDALVKRLTVLAAHNTGRIASGRIRSWGAGFLVGNVSLSSYLTYLGLPTVSYPYHALSAASDAMQLMQEFRPWDLQLFGVRWVVAPNDAPVPAGLKPLDRFGRWTLWEVPGTGLFDVVQVPYRWVGPKAGVYKVNETWLTDPLRWWGQYVELALDGPALPGDLHPGDLAPPPTKTQPPYGRVLGERRDGDRYLAEVVALAPAWVRVSIAYHPWLRVTVDGKSVKPVMVTPGFTAIPVTQGSHLVEVR